MSEDLIITDRRPAFEDRSVQRGRGAGSVLASPRGPADTSEQRNLDWSFFCYPLYWTKLSSEGPDSVHASMDLGTHSPTHCLQMTSSGCSLARSM